MKNVSSIQKYKIKKLTKIDLLFDVVVILFVELGEDLGLRVFENKVLRTIFRSKREGQVTEKELHNEELHNMFSSPNNSSTMK